MLHYDYGYKHLKYVVGNVEMLIELSVDNFMEQETYSAKTDYLFYDDKEQSWGHACGVGSSEDQALKMCLGEIKDYTGINPILSSKDDSIPQRITIENKDDIVILYYLNNNDGDNLLTLKGTETINLGEFDILTYLIKNYKQYKDCSVETEKLDTDKNIQFKSIFETMTKKYSDTAVIDSEKDK
ncbi:MAG: hypothetical protein IJS74_03320 [Clostridia bacterium]|nr:hypothetical protein [Clostridia bacterium]